MAGVGYKPMENAGKSIEPPVVKNAGMEKMLILSHCPFCLTVRVRDRTHCLK